MVTATQYPSDLRMGVRSQASNSRFAIARKRIHARYLRARAQVANETEKDARRKNFGHDDRGQKIPAARQSKGMGLPPSAPTDRRNHEMQLRLGCDNPESQLLIQEQRAGCGTQQVTLQR
jgi:hypothetical protein